MSDDYFKVRIENPERKGRMPTYAVLGERVVSYELGRPDRTWSIDDTLQMIRESSVKPEFLFMLIADQQTPSPLGMNDDTDRLFGRLLTGAKRTTHSNYDYWEGDYSIHRKQFESTARTLYDNYNHFTPYGTQETDAIIIDVLSPNNNWLYGEKRKNQVEDELCEHVLKRILMVFDEMDVARPKLFFAGFGRGALLAYHLAGRMSGEASKVVLTSIDSRVNEGCADEKSLICNWFKKKKGKWISVKKRPTTHRDECFPVLHPLPGVRCYNVFQRHNFSSTAMEKSAAWPVGCAIDGAVSPADFDVEGFKPCDGPSPFEQWDVTIGEHATDMLDRYAPWIIDVADREGFIAMPMLEGIYPEGGLAGTVITLTGRNLDNCFVIIRDDEGAQSDVTVSQVDVKPDRKTLTFSCPDNLSPGLKRVFLEKAGKYSAEVTFAAAPYVSSVGIVSQIVGGEVTLNGYFRGDWKLHIKGSGVDETVEMSGNGDAMTFTVPHKGANYSTPNVGPVVLQAESADGVMGKTFDFVIAPYIESVTPSSGLPGTDVVINAYIGDGGVNTHLRFCNHTSTLDTDVLSNDRESVGIKVPDGWGGEYDSVLVCFDAGFNEIYSNIEHFTINAAITGFSPAVQLNGLYVAVHGLGFTHDDDVLLSDVGAGTENEVGTGAKMVDMHTMSFQVQTDVGKKEVVVVSKDGRRSNTATYGIAPYIDASTSPTSALPGEEVHLKGYFSSGVFFYRDTEVDSWLIDDNTLGFKVPEVAAGNGEIKIKYDFDKAGNIVNFAVKPKITALSMLVVSVDDVLTITGVGFTDACRLYIDGVEVTASYDPDSDAFEWVVPPNIKSGPTSATVVDTATGLAGNSMEFGVTPYIKFLSTESEAPGATIVAHGFFRSDDHIQMEGREAVTEVNDEHTLSFTMPLLRRGGSGEVVVVEGERRSNDAHCEVDFVAWPVVEARSGGGGEYHWLAAMDSACYHRADCWRVEKMATEDLLGFASREDAWLFGFEPCNCVKDGGEQAPEKTLPAGYVADATHLKHSFDFPYYGNVKSRELHQEPCIRKVSDIPIASRIGFSEPEEAHAHGFDNCHYCLGDSER